LYNSLDNVEEKSQEVEEIETEYYIFVQDGTVIRKHRYSEKDEKLKHKTMERIIIMWLKEIVKRYKNTVKFLEIIEKVAKNKDEISKKKREYFVRTRLLEIALILIVKATLAPPSTLSESGVGGFLILTPLESHKSEG